MIVKSIFYAYYKHNKSDKISLYCRWKRAAWRFISGRPFREKENCRLPIICLLSHGNTIASTEREKHGSLPPSLSVIIYPSDICKDTTDNRGTKVPLAESGPPKSTKHSRVHRHQRETLGLIAESKSHSQYGDSLFLLASQSAVLFMNFTIFCE